jgi:GNAT superfamily N-acetyltransferase
VGGNGVDPDWGGQGVGRFQIDHLLGLFRAQGMRFAEVSTGLNGGHLPARAMYEGLGFTPLTRSVRYAMPL